MGDDHDETWDFCPEVLENESFLSWFTRLAKENCSDVRLLYHQLKRRRSLKNIKISVIEQELPMLESDDGIRKEIIRSLTPFLRIEIENNENLSQMWGKVESKWDFLNMPLKSPRFCPHCLHEDNLPYFRNSWFRKPYTICYKHQCILLDSCPHCGAVIEFWKTQWNEPIECCHKCGLKIYDTTHGIFYIRGTDHYKFIQEVYESSRFNSIKIEPYLFFRQLWKVIVSESESTFIKDLHSVESPIPVELLYKEISKGLIKIYNNPKKLDEPFEERMSYNILSQAINSNELLGEKEGLLLKINPYVKKRLEILAPLLEFGSPSIKEIREIAKNAEYHWQTVYGWWREYREKGIEGLIPNFSISGRKKGGKIKRYPEFYTLYQEKIFNYVKNREKKSVKELFKELQEDGTRMGIPKGVLSYSTLSKRVADQRSVLKNYKT